MSHSILTISFGLSETHESEKVYFLASTGSCIATIDPSTDRLSLSSRMNTLSTFSFQSFSPIACGIGVRVSVIFDSVFSILFS